MTDNIQALADLVEQRVVFDEKQPLTAARVADALRETHPSLDETIMAVFAVLQGRRPLHVKADSALEQAVCRHCQRGIVNDPSEGWICPEAGYDEENDGIWRTTCENNHEDRIAAHEPGEPDVSVTRFYNIRYADEYILRAELVPELQRLMGLGDYVAADDLLLTQGVADPHTSTKQVDLDSGNEMLNFYIDEQED